MTIDENLMCSFQVLKPDETKSQNNANSGGRPGTPNKKVFFEFLKINLNFFLVRQLKETFEELELSEYSSSLK